MFSPCKAFNEKPWQILLTKNSLYLLNKLFSVVVKDL